MTYNKIQVAFGALRKITGPSLEWQYNEKQILVITGLDLPEYYAVDFCNEGDADTITMTASAVGVEIPDQFLLTGKRLIAYIVVVDGEAVNTVGQITFPVNARGRRTDISPEPAEQQQIDELIDVLNEAAIKAIPQGGLAGQVLSKKTDDDYDMEWIDQSGGGGGTTNYNRLTNKPQINGVELSGNKTAHDLGLAAQTDIPTVPVQSVNGKIGAVNLASGDIAYDESATYQAGSVGAELQEQNRHLNDLDDGKQDAPSTAGTAGQVLGLNDQLQPVWMDQTGGGGGGGGMNIVNLSGTQITQVGADNTFYVCGKLTELAFTAPSVGITMIRFTSGTTPTVCTINGVTKWMYDFDPTTDIEASKTYDINVLNGIGVAGWA